MFWETNLGVWISNSVKLCLQVLSEDRIPALQKRNQNYFPVWFFWGASGRSKYPWTCWGSWLYWWSEHGIQMVKRSYRYHCSRCEEWTAAKSYVEKLERQKLFCKLQRADNDPALQQNYKHQESVETENLANTLQLRQKLKISKMMWTSDNRQQFKQEFSWNSSYIKHQNSVFKCYRNLGRSKQQV